MPRTRSASSGTEAAASRISSTSSHGGADGQREPVQRGPDRVRLDLRAGHQLAALRRRVLVVQRRGRRPDHDHAPAQQRRVGLAVEQGRRTRRSGSSPAARGSRSARRRRPKRAGRPGLPSRSATVTASVGRPATSAPKRRITPPASSGRLLAAARAPIRSRFSSPPSTLRAAAPVGLARGQHGAARAADRVVEREVLAVGALLRVLDVDRRSRARRPRRGGRPPCPSASAGTATGSPRSENVTSSTATTATSSGACASRFWKRRSSAAFSIGSSAPVNVPGAGDRRREHARGQQHPQPRDAGARPHRFAR